MEPLLRKDKVVFDFGFVFLLFLHQLLLDMRVCEVEAEGEEEGAERVVLSKDYVRTHSPQCPFFSSSVREEEAALLLSPLPDGGISLILLSHCHLVCAE